jgi:hypothetical protein
MPTKRVGDGSVTVRYGKSVTTVARNHADKHKAKAVDTAPWQAKAPAIVKPQRKLYLAYGSNLHIKAMQHRCPDAEPVLDKKTGMPKHKLLGNVRLVFRGVADLEWDTNGVTPVGLWMISERDERALDRYEGYPRLYDKFHIRHGDIKQALIYLMTDRDGIYPPSAYYASTIRDGYRNFGIDQRYLDDAIEHALLYKNPSEQTTNRRARQKKDSRNERLVRVPESVQIKRLELARERAEQERLASEQRYELERDGTDNPLPL